MFGLNLTLNCYEYYHEISIDTLVTICQRTSLFNCARFNNKYTVYFYDRMT